MYVKAIDFGVQVTGRLLVPARSRRDANSKIWQDLLRRIEAAPNIDLAYPTTRFYRADMGRRRTPSRYRIPRNRKGRSRMTERIYSTDSYAAEMSAEVVAADRDDRRVLLDRTVFYPGGGGQPIDQGALWVGDDRLEVVKVTQDADGVWHWLDEGVPGVGTQVEGRIDWERRYLLMRTHTSLHALCGVVWDWFRSP